MNRMWQLHITQHKRFALWAHPNFCFAKTSFMLGTLGEMADLIVGGTEK